MRGRKWTPEETEIVLTGYRNGDFAADIGKRLSRSKSSITNQARNMGFSHKLTQREAVRRSRAKLSEDDVQHIREVYASRPRHWRKLLARRFNVCTMTISRVVKGQTGGHLGKV